MVASQHEDIEVVDDEISYPSQVLEVGVPPSDLSAQHGALVLHSSTQTFEGSATDVYQNLSIGTMSTPSADAEIPQRPRRAARALAYIYCNSQLLQRSGRLRIGRNAEPTTGYDTTALLSSLLRQLYQFLPKDQDDPLLRGLCFESRQDYPSREDIIKGIKNVVHMFSQAFIVIDGLDECSGLDSLEFEGFCNFLASLAKPAGTRSAVNIVIFSRPGYPAINNAILGCPTVEVDKGENSEDIGRFIGDRSKNLKINSESLEEIQDHLQNSADGMFLWVSLTIDSIKNERTPKKMKAAARNVSNGLSGAYTDALKRVIRKESSIRDLALKALLWAANSKEPLTKSQLLEALVIEPEMTSIDDDAKVDGTQLTSDCEDLVILSDGTYTLLHSSLGDFLRHLSDDDPEGLQVYGALQKRASRILAGDCITYLKLSVFGIGPKATEESFNEMLRDYPFIEYAGKFWGDHLREALQEDDPELRTLANELLRRQASCELLHQIRLAKNTSVRLVSYGLPKHPFPFKTGTLPVHLLAMFGLQSLANSDDFSATELVFNQPDGLGFYAIDYATICVHQGICRWLLAEHESRQSYGIDPKDTIGRNSKARLMAATVENHWTDIVSILLRLGFSGADQYHLTGQTALHLAASLGYADVVELFMKSGDDPDMLDATGRTPLIMAAASERVGVMKTLIKHFASVSRPGLGGITPLHLVAGFDNCEMVEELIQRGASVHATWMRRTPLHEAALRGHRRVIESLLKFGADKDATTGNGVTPLMLAAEAGKLGAVSILLQNGANVTAAYDHLATALHWAALGNHVEVVSMILKTPKGLQTIDQKDGLQQTSLHFAACFGSVACAAVLLQNGARVDSEDYRGDTPLFLGLESAHTLLASKLLEDHGADPKHINREGQTSLHIAAKAGQPKLVPTLLSSGVDPRCRDHFRNSALFYAVQKGHKEFVECLIKNVSPRDLFGKDPELLGKSLSNFAPFCHAGFHLHGLVSEQVTRVEDHP